MCHNETWIKTHTIDNLNTSIIYDEKRRWKKWWRKFKWVIRQRASLFSSNYLSHYKFPFLVVMQYFFLLFFCCTFHHKSHFQCSVGYEFNGIISRTCALWIFIVKQVVLRNSFHDFQLEYFPFFHECILGISTSNSHL